jgi:hypothetical protein
VLERSDVVLYTDQMHTSSALQSRRESEHFAWVAKAMKGPTGRVLATVASGVLLAFALGFRPVVEYSDLRCAAGTVPRPVSIAYWAVRCEPSEASSEPTTVPTRRYVGLFLTNVDVRVFDADLLADDFHGPALNVRLGR